ncbi:MAG: hypothetical protein NTX98_01935 [Candidatus Doudnabacteria bacterium]|nr:hypothetical protein [Candidatus Doudnabacteria bacterium]
MFKNSSPQTKSFVILLAIAIAGTYFCLLLAKSVFKKANYQKTPQDSRTEQIISYKNGQNNSLLNQANAEEPEINTTNWKTYSDQKYKFSFKYNPEWKIKPWAKQDGYNVLEIDPGKKYYNIKIYTSLKDFYVMGGLPTQEVLVGGEKALNVSDLLYGVKKGDYYYTFDIGLSLSLKPQFDALVKTIKFE